MAGLQGVARAHDGADRSYDHRVRRWWPEQFRSATNVAEEKEGNAMSARTPEECDTLFERHLNAGDLDALVGLYEPGATLVMAPGEASVGHAAIREALGGLIAQKARLTLTVAQVLRAGDDVAVLYGEWHGHYTDPDGALAEVAGQSVEVVRRQADGTWRFAIDDPFGRG